MSVTKRINSHEKLSLVIDLKLERNGVRICVLRGYPKLVKTTASVVVRYTVLKTANKIYGP